MINILQTSIYIIKTFNRLKSAQSHATHRLYVHSVYERTINLMLDGQLVALQTANSPVSPISIILPLDEAGMRDLRVQKGDLVSFDGTILSVGCTEINLDSLASIYDDQLSSYSVTKNLQAIVLTLINKSDRTGFSILTNPKSRSEDLVLSYVQGLLHKIADRCNKIQSIASEDDADLQSLYSNISSSLSSLIGVGTGLTPSGDDFLTGILSTFTAFPDSFDRTLINLLRDSVYNHLADTNEISRSFIMCALNGKFSLPLIELYDRICSKDPNGESSETFLDDEQIDVLLKKFLAIGHSSGIDTLTGIWWSMTYLFKN